MTVHIKSKQTNIYKDRQIDRHNTTSKQGREGREQEKRKEKEREEKREREREKRVEEEIKS